MLRKIWLIALVVAAFVLYVNRLKLFVRDPLAAVTRNGVFQDGTRVYLNYDSDVLMENTQSTSSLTLLQHGQPIGVAAPLNCLLNALCIASAYPAPQIASLPGARLESMTGQEVHWKDGEGQEVVVKLH